MKGKLVVSVISVFAAGLALGLLIAPRKGKKTRKLIKSAVLDYVDRAHELIGKVDIPDVEERSGSINPGV